MLKAYKYRIYPTKHQKEQIERTFSACRLVYNLALECKIRAWQSAKVRLSSFDLCYQLPELKEAYPWLKTVDSQALQASIKKIDGAFNNFFSGAGYPKFRKKSGVQSFHSPNYPRRIDFEKSMLTISKIKDIRVGVSRQFLGDVKTITISRTRTGKYFASILVNDKKELPVKQIIEPQKTIGIDMGIKSFVVTSDGKIYEPNRRLKNSLKRLQCLQRRSSRKKKGSKNRKKANLCVAKLHEKIRNQRIDYCHKVTTELIRDNQTETFVIENLAVANILKNRKLSQAISDVGFGEFIRQMKYKCDWRGKNLIQIGRFEPSSKVCSECRAVNEALTLADREWICASCGTFHERDHNAAKNIKRIGLEKYSGQGMAGGPVESRRVRRAKKQEMISNYIPTIISYDTSRNSQ